MPQFDEDLDETVQMIWSTMFGLPLTRQSEATTLSDGPLVTGFVILEGAFDGAVLVRCPQSLAQQLTSLMFGDDNPGQSDIRDAIGELANMTAGNIKAVLPHPSRIGLPVVAFGQDYHLQVLGTETAGTVTYECLGELMSMTLVRQEEREGARDR